DEASSSEFGITPKPVVGLMTEWERDGIREERDASSDLGGSMRLGAYEAKLKPGSRVHEIYGTDTIHERHRHRFEVNMTWADQLADKGVVFSGTSPDGQLPEIMEIPDHPWFIGVQYHPELKSRPFDPHPLFASFIDAAVKRSRLV
ncbi:MAG: gamma-glutamyl-gamma-aminobutyrate hydrolase family protein, partial [Pseudomonadota bacterium]